MSGHSKWAGIKHKKAIIDSKRGKVFTRLAREITIAAKEGGGKPEHNARLRKAIEDARAANMPQDNVKRAIQKGTGELPGVSYEELRYEAYGAGGVAMLVDLTTDSRNRTSSEIRKIFSDYSGNIAESGAVAWMFATKAYITVEKSKIEEEKLLEIVLEAGAEDLKSTDEDIYEIYADPKNIDDVKAALSSKNIEVASAEVTLIPENTIALDEENAKKVLDLIDALEEHDDVKNVYANFDISKEIMEKLGQ